MFRLVVRPCLLPKVSDEAYLNNLKYCTRFMNCSCKDDGILL